MKIFRLNGEVINIGDWNFKPVPVINKSLLSLEDRKKMADLGQDPNFSYDDNGDLIYESSNPLPVGAVESDEEVVTTEDGGICVVGDHVRLRTYPPVSEQLDYIYHHGVEKWKSDIIDPVKLKYPKGQL